MKKIIEGKRNLLISIVLHCLSISIFLISQLSIVSGTFMSGSVFSYNYPLRVAMNCLAIVLIPIVLLFVCCVYIKKTYLGGVAFSRVDWMIGLVIALL